MKDAEPPKRRSVRLKPFDYSWPGSYFITVCARNRRCIFGRIEDGQAKLNSLGVAVRECWLEIPTHFASIELGEFVVMPNHLHGILTILRRARHGVPLQSSSIQLEKFGKPTTASIPTVVRLFKQAVMRRWSDVSPGRGPIWQRGYYEHVIRNEEDLISVSDYIRRNPQTWDLDEENPARHEQP